MVQTISILGSTGSIGQNTLDVVRRHGEAFDVRVLTAGNNWQQLAKDAKEFLPSRVNIQNEAHFEALKEALADLPIQVSAGQAGLLEVAAVEADICLAAIVGAAGIAPIFEAVKVVKRIALANKEALVCTGQLLIQACQTHGVELLPVDSEHNAIHQLLQGVRDMSDVAEITLTASGGPFLTRDLASFSAITPQEAVAHPNWSMGAKISVDSATMMNKGLELIEAYHLFPVEAAQLKAVIHPQSLVHGVVSMKDGSMLAQMGDADMRVPIAYCLGQPQRMASGVAPLSLETLGRLEFMPVEAERFPALELAYEAMRQGQGACVALNAANEVAVQAFLEGRISFPEITQSVAKLLESQAIPKIATLEDVVALDAEVRGAMSGVISPCHPAA